MCFGHGFDSRLVHSKTRINWAFCGVEIKKVLKKVLKRL
nr:MAG TPA: hypothetical protein [Bacteriophage sp.]